MDRARKKIASAIDGIRNNLHLRTELEVSETVTNEHCFLADVVRHGFPADPKCLAIDPVQKLVAIGAGNGCVRLLGQPGVDFNLKHDSNEPVLHVQFLVNEGGLITALRDDSIHLWNYRQKRPEIVHSIKLSKEKISCIYLPFQSKWLHADFELSTYVINWNKAIDLSCRVHPGAVCELSACPTEPSKLLMLYEKGQAVLWNVTTRESERFCIDTAPVKCFCWSNNGREIMCGHKDGSITVWNIKKPKECLQKTTPHAPNENVACRPITHLDWAISSEGDQLILFTGGMPSEEAVLPALTILRSKGSVTVLEMDHSIIELGPMYFSPFKNAAQFPYAVGVLLKSDFLVIDLATNGASYPCFESPYSFDIHESPVTLIKYFSDCPVDLIAALTLVGRNQRRQGVKLSGKPWPVTGGVARECATGYQEIVITGHEDGSLKYWHASGENLEIMYKLKTGRHFEKTNSNESRTISNAVKDIHLCVDSRLLLVSSANGQVTLFRFVKQESSQDIAVVTLPQLCSSTARSNSPMLSAENEKHQTPSPRVELRRQTDVGVSHDSQHSTDTSCGSQIAESIPVKVRGGHVRRPAGYQPELVCQIPWVNGETPEQLTAIALNSSYGIIAIGSCVGVALVDLVSSSVIYTWSNSELYNRESIPFSLPSQNSDASPSELLSNKRKLLKATHSTVTPPTSNSSNAKTFIRLNTEFKQRSAERQRPPLSKAQSVATSAHELHFLDANCNGDLRSEHNSLSPSPSNTSLDKVVPNEFVTSLQFIACCSKKGSTKVETTLWLGVSTGAIVAFNLMLPADRLLSNVVVAPSGSVIRLQERILYTAFMDKNLCLIGPATETFRDPNKDSAPSSANAEKVLFNKVFTKASFAPTITNAAEMGGPATDELSQLGIFVAEQEIRVVTLPGYHQVFHRRPDIPLVKAQATHVRNYPVLMCLNGAGQLIVFSLPSLKILMQSPLFRCSVDIDDPICAKIEFSDNALGCYAATTSEIQKFSACAEINGQVKECVAELFVPCDMPEAPKASSFFQGVSTLFSGNQKEAVDLDAIFAEKPTNSTTVSSVKSVARQLPSSSLTNMENAQRQNISAGQAAAMAMQNLNERSEKLSATIDATEQLRNNAMSLQSRSSKLVEKYEKKKWWQL
ncbi:Syntaxin-binding protein 5 [Aphelenchoides bicaudatus]|nr:Syntaxin-binding protein 5 [Aphelenchoides bicaudatus]